MLLGDLFPQKSNQSVNERLTTPQDTNALDLFHLVYYFTLLVRNLTGQARIGAKLNAPGVHASATVDSFSGGLMHVL